MVLNVSRDSFFFSLLIYLSKWPLVFFGRKPGEIIIEYTCYGFAESFFMGAWLLLQSVFLLLRTSSDLETIQGVMTFYCVSCPQPPDHPFLIFFLYMLNSTLTCQQDVHRRMHCFIDLFHSFLWVKKAMLTLLLITVIRSRSSFCGNWIHGVLGALEHRFDPRAVG